MLSISQPEYLTYGRFLWTCRTLDRGSADFRPFLAKGGTTSCALLGPRLYLALQSSVNVFRVRICE